MNLSDHLKDESLLTQALTHRSYCNEHPNSSHNERLEFLGDSILSLVISDRMYRLLPESPEGELTARRSHLVQTSTLAQKARLLELDQKILLSKGEEDSGGRANPGLLANTFEAVLGAIFLDNGISQCYKFLEEIFPDSEIISEAVKAKDPKSLLQELSQAKGMGTPVYRIVSASGPDHARQFVVGVIIDGDQKATGEGLSKQKAETQAAISAISLVFPEHKS